MLVVEKFGIFCEFNHWWWLDVVGILFLQYVLGLFVAVIVVWFIICCGLQICPLVLL